jgi:hypothetical protein
VLGEPGHEVAELRRGEVDERLRIELARREVAELGGGEAAGERIELTRREVGELLPCEASELRIEFRRREVGELCG